MTAPSKIRIGGSRSKNGCGTCRLRRVKCDEGVPSCQRCLRADLQCRPAQVVAVQTKPRAHKFVIYTSPKPQPDISSLDSPARLMLDFFHVRTALQLGNQCAASLWTTAIPTGIQTEAAIRYAVIALAAMHQWFEMPGNPEGADNKLALVYYGKALGALRKEHTASGPRATEVFLLCCILFCATEALQGHFSSSVSHITSGIRVLTEANDTSNTEHTDNQVSNKAIERLSYLEGLRHAFVSMGSMAMAIEGTGIERFACLSHQDLWRAPISGFTAPELALVELTLLMNDVLALSFRSGISVGDDLELQQALMEEKSELLRRYSVWKTQHVNFINGVDGSNGVHSVTNGTIPAIIAANSHMFEVVFVMCKSQMDFDGHTAKFQAILRSCRQFIQASRGNSLQSGDDARFSMTLGIVPCLYFICTRCRDGPIRYEALQLLQFCKRREGVWDSQVVSKVASLWISLEERSAQDVYQTMTDSTAFVADRLIPRESRIDSVVTFSASANAADVSFIFETGRTVHLNIDSNSSR